MSTQHCHWSANKAGGSLESGGCGPRGAVVSECGLTALTHEPLPLGACEAKLLRCRPRTRWRGPAVVSRPEHSYRKDSSAFGSVERRLPRYAESTLLPDLPEFAQSV